MGALSVAAAIVFEEFWNNLAMVWRCPRVLGVSSLSMDLIWKFFRKGGGCGEHEAVGAVEVLSNVMRRACPIERPCTQEAHKNRD